MDSVSWRNTSYRGVAPQPSKHNKAHLKCLILVINIFYYQEIIVILVLNGIGIFFSIILLAKVSAQIKRHFNLDVLKIKIECALIFQCYFHFLLSCPGIFPSQPPVQLIFPDIVFQ